MGRLRSWVLVLLLGASFAGCASSERAGTPGTSAPWACGPEAEDCSPAEVIATVERLYEIAGATPAEAACLAPITGQGKHAVDVAFDVPQPGEMRAAIECVGSEARLRAIADAMADYFRRGRLGDGVGTGRGVG